MAQKDKVKELVGRGLDSYHTKALQQIDRINKKNKEQNHKISILTNELDNDYLTKTEEGSVISLEHSKEGMVYLDELQGNTLVNYCTDGSKEITLNGDIDVEGVDNVYNVIIKPNTLYTVALDTNKTGTIRINLGGAEVTTTNNVAMITTPETLTDNSLKLYGTNIKCSKVRLLEGDKTNWIPSYFEGMKSSFEDKLQDDGTYKMEILSNNKNFFDINKVVFQMIGYNIISTIEGNSIRIKNEHNTGYGTEFIRLHLEKGVYTINADINDVKGSSLGFRIFTNGQYSSATKNLTFNLKYNQEVRFYYYLGMPSTTECECLLSNIQIKKVSSENSYIEPKSNKIQFSSIEPLRGIGDVKDRFVFKDGKLMIERNIKRITFNGSKNWVKHSTQPSGTSATHTGFQLTDESLGLVNNNGETKVVCDKFIWSGDYHNIGEVIKNTNSQNAQTFALVVRNTKLTSLDSVGIKKFLQDNPIQVEYQLAEPIYEEIPFELQKIILEGYENGTLFFDTNIPPTSTVTYAGETPIVKSAKSNRVEVASNTTDINDNIIPYLCDMDYRIVVLELQQGQPIQADFYKLFGGVYEMFKRDILSKRLSKSEYEYRLTDYFNVGKLTEQQVRELEDLINE